MPCIADCEITISARENFDSPNVWPNRVTLLQNAQKAVPQGRSEGSKLRFRSRLSEDSTCFISALTSALTFPKTLAGFFSILPLDIWDLPVNRSQPGIGKVSVDAREASASIKLSDR